ncbi:hypothetical protein [Paracraurococcus ruber]|uniref:hypothetical protein n=1 Tax=Paracraurococcus ruber TaxID=77675 RepID=UPI0013051B88|nr:hypothetical protein [Paracraurococcus ruber]
MPDDPPADEEAAAPPVVPAATAPDADAIRAALAELTPEEMQLLQAMLERGAGNTTTH